MNKKFNNKLFFCLLILITTFIFVTSQALGYVVINSNTEIGFQDLTFNIDKYWVDEKLNHNVQAFGEFENNVVGFIITFKSDMKMGVINNRLVKDAFYREGITVSSLGKESDIFLNVLAKLYEIKQKNLKMKQKVSFTSFALGGDPQNFQEENLKFKCFYENEQLYSEFYINVDLKKKILEFKEKDPEYRKNILKAFSE